MDLRHHSRNAAAADQMRRANERRGYSGRGALWTEDERATVQRFYPDYRALKSALPNRTHWAIQKQAQQLCAVRSPHIWTAAEHSRVRAMFPQASRQAILDALPGLSWRQITCHAWKSGFRRSLAPYRPTSWPLLDEVRVRCRELGYTMGDLDQLAGTKKYFKRQHWRNSRLTVSLAVAKAVVALDGKLRAAWRT